MENKIRIGALISGGGTNLQAVIDSCESGEINGSIVFIGTDNPKAKGLQRAKKHGIPSFIVDYTSIIRSYKTLPEKVKMPSDFDFQDILKKQSIFSDKDNPERIKAFLYTRAAAEAGILDKIKDYPFDLLILAGFMRNLTPYFIDSVNTTPGKPKIMNIHPALLPSFPGVDGYGDTFRYGCKVGGCTVHFIDYGEDSGPIIGQRAFDITKEDTLDTIKEKGLKLEWELYPECIRLFSEGRLKILKKIHTLESGKQYKRTVADIV
ncbi:MAG: phosphoribosylglycinamide formyltransferase [Deltaproteobacteria bacterium]|nr:phosphoribosylglycinamide formyltransferase [Deltaproteobacteria bacterium]MBW2218669.1 phosphoribosylglycinamide formyltransferase [Deltaproteobacteria bacterium]